MTKLKFAHIADLHLGGWREKTMKDLNFKSFKETIDIILNEGVDFVIFAGDIFDSPMPQIDVVEKFVEEINRLKKENIYVYVIGGSHDYSNSGKSFISLLDKSSVFVDVCKFERLDNNKIELIYTSNEDLKLNIVGVLGKKHGLDKNIYTNISNSNLRDDYLNIFVFHTTIDNFKPSFMKQVKTEVTMDYLPKGFDYYAGGHIHMFMEGRYDSGIISYSGCLFPNNFTELKREIPGFNICEYDFNSKKISLTRRTLTPYFKELIKLDFNGENPVEIYEVIKNELDSLDLNGKILLIELSGVVNGRISDININKLIALAYDGGALQVLKNTYKLSPLELENKKREIKENVEEIENFIIKESLDKLPSSNEEKEFEKIVIDKIIKLDLSKQESEKKSEFEERIITTLDGVLELD